MTHRALLNVQMATRSPGRTPASTRPAPNLRAALNSSACVRRTSPSMMAGRSAKRSAAAAHITGMFFQLATVSVGRGRFQRGAARSTERVACWPTALAFVERIAMSCPSALARSAPTVQFSRPPRTRERVVAEVLHGVEVGDAVDVVVGDAAELLR